MLATKFDYFVMRVRYNWQTTGLWWKAFEETWRSRHNYDRWFFHKRIK